MPDAVTHVDVLEARLLAWAAWLTSGGGGAGYPTRSVLHQSWLPPAPGEGGGGAPVRHGGVQEARLHRIITAALSVRLQNTLVVVYLMRAKPAEQVQLLGCQASTVRARVGEAKRLLARELDRVAA